MSRRALPAVLVFATALALLTAPASAKSPPNGKYDCTISGVGYFDKVKILDNNSYKRYGKKGTYKAGDRKINFNDGFKGWKIKFKTGPFKDFKGRWYKTSDGRVEIALATPEDPDFESVYCVEE